MDKSVLLHRRCWMSKFPEILILLCRKIFSVFCPIFHKTFSNSCGFAFILEFNLFLRISSPHVVLYYRKHFYWILTNLSNLSQRKSSIVPFAKFRSDLKSVLTKHFPTMDPFANILQSRSSYSINFLIFARKYLCWSLTWWPSTLLKSRPLLRCFPVN